jgi:hypothetical protein
MKNIKKLNNSPWVSCIVIFMMVVSCQTIDETFEEFTIDGETIYIGRSDTVIVGAGYNKLRFWVAINSDPKISKGLLESNDGSVRHEFDVVRTKSGNDTISFDLDVEEGEYNFGLFLLDNNGNSSVRREFQATAYGEKYKSSLINRGILNIEAYETNAIFHWSDAPRNAIETLLTYEDGAGVMQTVNVSNDDTQTTVDSYKRGGRIIITTTYKPTENAIEVFEAEPFEKAFPEEFMLDKSIWNIIDFSTHHPGGANAVENAIDGNPGTRWHTYYGQSSYPHHVTVDMGVERTISSFELFRMTNDDRACDTFQLLVSTDNETWIDLGQFNFNRFTNEGQLYSITSQPKARYFKFVGSTGPHDYMVIGEIKVYGM